MTVKAVEYHAVLTLKAVEHVRPACMSACCHDPEELDETTHVRWDDIDPLLSLTWCFRHEQVFLMAFLKS